MWEFSICLQKVWFKFTFNYFQVGWFPCLVNSVEVYNNRLNRQDVIGQKSELNNSYNSIKQTDFCPYFIAVFLHMAICYWMIFLWHVRAGIFQKFIVFGAFTFEVGYFDIIRMNFNGILDYFYTFMFELEYFIVIMNFTGIFDYV